MSWARIDDQFATHAKVVAAGNEAVGCWVRCLTWSAAHLTDGIIPLAVAGMMAGGRDDVLERLFSVGLLERTSGDDGDAYVIHDYLAWNPSRKQVEKERKSQREQRVAAGKSRAAKAQRDASGAFSERASGSAGEPLMPSASDQPAPSPSPSPIGEKSATVRLEQLGEAAASLGVYAVSRSEQEWFGRLHPVGADELAFAMERASGARAKPKRAAYLLEIIESERVRSAQEATRPRAARSSKRPEKDDWVPSYLRTRLPPAGADHDGGPDEDAA